MSSPEDGVDGIPLLDKGILVAFQATGICRMVLVIQTCDLSEPDSMLT